MRHVAALLDPETLKTAIRPAKGVFERSVCPAAMYWLLVLLSTSWVPMFKTVLMEAEGITPTAARPKQFFEFGSGTWVVAIPVA